ncbi:MAG: hypothetical protein IPL26_00605 [Leptospiraceae bacterium]|nr:hypothetical protein [Leptospiraceae bacterium]
MTNLLSNAIKFTESGTVQLQVSKEKASLLFEVMDTGIGIPLTNWIIFSESFSN